MIAHACCNGDGVFIELRDGSMWWRRHEWPSDKWQPIIPPPPEAPRRTRSIETAKVKPARRRRR